MSEGLDKWRESVKEGKKWNTKLVHPTMVIEPCPACGFPEADAGYCPECDFTVPQPGCPHCERKK